jgi:predicted transcriptional regulator
VVGCNVQVVLKKDGITGSFSFDVTKRILQALEHHGERKTNLAQKTGLNYNACMRYIGMLKTLGWIQMVRFNEGDYVSITVVGRQVSSKLLDTSSVNAVASNTNDRQTENIQAKEKESKQPNSLLPRKERIEFTQTSPINPSMNIMIVDDEPDILLTYQSFLTPEGYNVEGSL